MEPGRHHWLVALSAAALIHSALLLAVGSVQPPAGSAPAPILIKLDGGAMGEGTDAGAAASAGIAPVDPEFAPGPEAKVETIETSTEPAHEPESTEVETAPEAIREPKPTVAEAPPAPEPAVLETTPEPQPAHVETPEPVPLAATTPDQAVPKRQAPKPEPKPKPTPKPEPESKPAPKPPRQPTPKADSPAAVKPDAATRARPELHAMGSASEAEGARAGRGAGDSAGQSGARGGAALAGYNQRLAAWINRHRRYPDQARRLGQQGTVKLRFTLDPNGRLVSHQIVTSSGHRLLDEEVAAMLRRASPMPKPPAGLGGGSTTVTVPISFALR